MPRLRFQLPISVEISKEDLRAVERAVDVAKKVKGAGLVESLRELGNAARDALDKRQRDRASRVR